MARTIRVHFTGTPPSCVRNKHRATTRIYMQYLEDINQGALHKSQLNHEPGLLVHAAKPAYPRPWVQLMPPGSRAPAIVGHVLLPLEPHGIQALRRPAFAQEDLHPLEWNGKPGHGLIPNKGSRSHKNLDRVYEPREAHLQARHTSLKQSMYSMAWVHGGVHCRCK